MKVATTILVVFVISHAYSATVTRNSTPKPTDASAAVNKTSTSTSKSPAPVAAVPKNPPSKSTDAETLEVSPGVTISKGFQRGNCLASRFAVLCASGSIDGCVTKNSKTKCGKQCVCGATDCACGTSGCYCQVTAGCSCKA